MHSPTTPRKRPYPNPAPPAPHIWSIAVARARGYAILSTSEETTDYLLTNPLSPHHNPFNRDNPSVRASMRSNWFYPRTRAINARMQFLQSRWWDASLAYRRMMWYATAGVLRGKWKGVRERRRRRRRRRRLLRDGRRWLSPMGHRQTGIRIVLAGWREREVPGDVDKVEGEEGMLGLDVDEGLTEWVRPKAMERRRERLAERERVEMLVGMPVYRDVVAEARRKSARRRGGRSARVALMRTERNEMLREQFELQEGLPPLEAAASQSGAVPQPVDAPPAGAHAEPAATEDCTTTTQQTRRSSRLRRSSSRS